MKKVRLTLSRSLPLLAAFVGAGIAAATASASNLVLNPNFASSTSYTYPGYINYPSAGDNSVPEWTGTPLTPGVAATGTNTQGEPFWDNGSTPAGVTSVGILQLQASFSQLLSGLVTGNTYYFSFLYNARTGNSTTLTATLGDQTIFAPTSDSAVAGGGNFGPAFHSYSGFFQYDGVSPLLTFSSSTPTSDATSLITDVSITSTPEPSSLALLGTGVLGLAGLARRRFVKA